MVVRSALVTREDGEVDWGFKIIQSLLTSLGIGLADTLGISSLCQMNVFRFLEHFIANLDIRSAS